MEDGEAHERGELDKKLYEALIHGTRASNSFPKEEDELAYYESLPEFKERIAGFRSRIVKLILELAANVDSSDDLFNLGYLENADVSEKAAFEPIADVIELLLENVDSCLDEAKQPGSSSFRTAGQKNHEVALSKSELVRDVRAGLHGVVTHADIVRPQLKFTTPVDNSKNPFKPRITSKPNAITPLPPGGLSLVDETSVINNDAESHARSLGMDVGKLTQPRYEHPYEIEIKSALNAQLPSFLYDPARMFQKPQSLSNFPCHWVDTEDKLISMCSELEGELAIAVDLENHSYRSFQGFVCLMQISSSKADYLVDTLVLREYMQMLNVHFTNPGMVKVLHGSDSDVLWLQRDFGLYLVNMFDTGQAARALQYPSAGLAYALQRHCSVRANKAYQLADWRIRPLTEEMAKYAREDTHYLLYIFDTMRSELIHTGGSEAVFGILKRSAEIALTVYEKEICTMDSVNRLVKVKNLHLTPRQMQILSTVYTWRDAVARREDESTQYVLPDRMLIRIAQEMPTASSELENCCNPLPPVIQTRITELLAVIRSAQEATTDEGEDNEVQVLTSPPKVSSNNITATAGAPQLPLATPQIGLNSLKTSFVPISQTTAAPTSGSAALSEKKGIVSFAEATRGQKAGNRRETILRDVVSARATPSPVLTTEQLYDTAGWQDISDPEWKAAAVARASASAKSLVSRNITSIDNSTNINFKTALETKARIGQEQLLNRTFGALRTSNTEEAGQHTSGLDETSMVEDSPGNIDLPADADALESDDIPRSMAEIYRISNRNRKRNKDKKKQKDEVSSATSTGPIRKASQGSSIYEGSGDESNSNRKRSKDGDDIDEDLKGANSDDAIRFMRDIGWVEGSNKPVATLLVEGAPVEPTHLAGAVVENQSGGPQVSGKAKGGSSVGGAKGRTNRNNNKIPSSPKRKGSIGGSPNSSRTSKHGQQQKGYKSANGFSYSQAAATSAGVRGGPRSSTQERQPRQGHGGHQSQQQPQTTYRKSSGTGSNSMSYRS